MERISKQRFMNASQTLSKLKICVIGDYILDEYLIGQVHRISPEAPVPVVWVRKEETKLGGAGNVIKNLHTLNTQMVAMGRIGNDAAGEKLEKLLIEENIKPSDLLLMKSKDIPTIVKTRVLAGHQQVCRIDREEIIFIDSDEEDTLFQQLEQKIEQCDAVILSDYDKGILSPSFIDRVTKYCKEKKKIVTVDPQVSHFFNYKNVSILTPNHHEAGKAIGKVLETDEDILDACKIIINKIQPNALMITRGEKGMSVFLSEDASIHHIPTVAREVFDVTGAGDTVITVYTAYHAAGLNQVEASLVANAAAGVVVGKLGAASATVDEIEEKLNELNVWL
jgi:rfaE bifunctional protein kinase chain/domain